MDGIIDERVIKRAPVPRAQAPARPETTLRAIGPTLVPAPAPAIPVAESCQQHILHDDSGIEPRMASVPWRCDKSTPVMISHAGLILRHVIYS